MPLAFFLLFAASFEESFRTGLMALQQNDLTAAESNLQSAARLQPTNGRVWIALAQTWWKLHEPAKAATAAEKAEKLAPTDKAVLQSLAIYYSETGERLKEADVRARNGETDRAADLYFALAQPLLQKEQFREAIAILEPAQARVGANAQIELALGVACYGLRRFDEAAAAFLRTIEIAPALEQPYAFLGRFLDQIPARLPEVTKRFIGLETANPTSATGYLLHAKALNAQSLDPETSLKLLRKAISLDNRDASAHFELASVLDRLQRLSDAIPEYEKAAALDPSDPATHYRLARDYDRTGNHDAARLARERHAKLVQAQETVR